MNRSLVYLAVTAALILSFVAAQLPVNAATMPLTATVIAHRLRIRQSASLKSMTIGVLKRGEALTILGKNALRARWLKIQTSGGVTGWISIAWVRFHRGVLLKDIPIVS